MQMSLREIGRRMRYVFGVMDRNQTITVTYRGKVIGIMEPAPSDHKQANVERPKAPRS
jgi:hypothetical protein